jgi:hypothetical protein
MTNFPKTYILIREGFLIPGDTAHGALPGCRAAVERKGRLMPVISMFYGIIILMYYFDNKRHNLAHVHAQDGEEEAVIAVEDGEVPEGSIPKRKLRLVQAWIEIHGEELPANWKLATQGQQVYKIDPLK